jgi:hypothetical protein
MLQEKLPQAAERCGFAKSGEKKETENRRKKEMTTSQMLKGKDKTNTKTEMEGTKQTGND